MYRMSSNAKTFTSDKRSKAERRESLALEENQPASAIIADYETQRHRI